MVLSLVSYVLGDRVLLSRNMLRSTVQNKKELCLADFIRLCQLTYAHCVRPASLNSDWLRVGGGGDGHDTLSRLVNLAVSLHICDSAVCIAVPLYIRYITFNVICVCFFRSESVGGRSA